MARLVCHSSCLILKIWKSLMERLGLGLGNLFNRRDNEHYEQAEAHNMVPRGVQVVDHVVKNSNKSSSNQRFIPFKVLTGKGITLNAQDLAVHEDHASKVEDFIMTNEKHVTCFSETGFHSK